jgi:hypothetical protein
MDSKLYFLIVLILAFTFISYNSSQSQSGWFIQNSGTTNNLSYIDFIDVNTGFTGDTLIKTINGGVNWIHISGAPLVTDIKFVDYNIGYISRGTIYKSTNGGLNWVNQNQTYRNKIYFIDRDTGYATGSYEWDPGLGQFVTNLLKSTNGGLNWFINMQTPQDPYVHIVFGDIAFKSPSTGYFVMLIDDSFNENGTSYIYRTTNYGTSWFDLFGSDSLDFYSIKYPTQDTTYFLAKKNIYHNNNSLPNAIIFKIVNDNTFSIVLSLTDKFLYGIHFVNGNTGYAVGDAGTILKTTNGGSSWYNQNSGVVTKLSQVYFANSSTGYIVGDNGVILKTTTAGDSLNSVSGTVRYRDNNQLVTKGYVKALKYDSNTNEIITVDSTNIQSNGFYVFHHCPGDSLYIMAFQDDESDQLFVATYYVSTTRWQDAMKVVPNHNLTNIDIAVYRINNNLGSLRIGGNVLAYTNSMDAIISVKDAVVYAFQGNNYKGYSVTNISGRFQIDSLSSGIFYLLVDRMGYSEVKRLVNLSNASIDTIIIYLNPPVGLEENNRALPTKFRLMQNYPNPFNPVTIIKIEVPAVNKSSSKIELVIYDVLGRKISALFEGNLPPGRYEFNWDGSNCASGVYFYKLITRDFTSVKKMVLIK